jgi:cytochrome c-type biogenesis protein CcmE
MAMLSRRKRQRLAVIALGLLLLAGAAAIILTQLEEHLVFFHSPSELQEKPQLADDRRLRVGGLVESGSVERPGEGVVRFRVTDLAATLPVSYRGILPDLFREGQGVVVEGRMRDGVFVADQVLAKHDETYMPPEVADALKRSGQWQHMGEKMRAQAQEPASPATEGSPR